MTAELASGSAAARSRAPVALALLGLVLLLVGLVGFAQGGLDSIRGQEPIDLDLNLVAGQRLLDRAPLYDLDASRRDALELGGPALQGSYTRPTNGFPGAPTTALVHAPFTLLDHPAGVTAFRLAALLGMIAAAAITARSLPPEARSVGMLLGTGGLVASYPFFQTLHLGQGHEFVMLGLAVGIWGTSTQRWGIAGAGLAVATILKISPVALLIYLLVRGKRQAVTTAAGTAVTLCLAAAALGRPGDLIVWLRDVVPGVSGGVTRSINQSLPAYLARVLSTDPDLSRSTTLGATRFIALPVMVIAIVALARHRRGRPVDPLELGIVILVGLIAGPLTWTHYWTWLALPLVLLADPRRWRGLTTAQTTTAFTAITVALLLLTMNVDEPPDAGLVQRLASGPNLFAGLLLLAVAVFLLPNAHDGDVEPRTGIELADEHEGRPAATV